MLHLKIRKLYDSNRNFLQTYLISSNIYNIFVITFYFHIHQRKFPLRNPLKSMFVLILLNKVQTFSSQIIFQMTKLRKKQITFQRKKKCVGLYLRALPILTIYFLSFFLKHNCHVSELKIS